MPGNGFKNKVRIRVNGILRKDDALLLVQLQSPVINKLVWMPPGGGLKFGESMKECLQREFREETGLEITVGSLCFVNELVQLPFHAVECYFLVQKTGGQLQLGSDPELPEDEQLIRDLQWMPVNQLDDLNIIPQQLGRLVRESPLKPETTNFYSNVY